MKCLAVRGIACASLLVLAADALAIAQAVDPATIRALAERHLRELAGSPPGLEVTAGRLDPRLAFAPCDGELTPFVSPGTAIRARTSVGIRCEGARPWSIYLPVEVSSEAAVLVARRSLARGETPTAADFDPGSRRVGGLASAFVATPEALAGRKLRRPVAAGEALPGDALETMPLVRRGQQVVVVAEGGGIEVRVAATALADAGPGDRVKLRNSSSGRTLEGTVRPDGSVATPR